MAALVVVAVGSGPCVDAEADYFGQQANFATQASSGTCNLNAGLGAEMSFAMYVLYLPFYSISGKSHEFY